MKLPISAHTSRPWRVHELTPDFDVEDVWALPTPGGPNELPRLVDAFMANDFFGEGAPLIVRALSEARWELGRLVGWDEPSAGVDARVVSLRDRLPADLRAAPIGPRFEHEPLTSVYLLEDEWTAEMANRTVHAVMHIGWVADGDGGHRGQMSVLVKPNGRFGAAYMQAIKPFRHFIVYPALLRWIGRSWEASAPPSSPQPATSRG